ncbi:YwiC-like family protein [Aneurinibacillus uraniidurans]|uniref:YwiC-like family protein n=1 Tax=Aneurinibacillus uraniidurans TaxID=2966586 RepID=UPI00234A2EC9|nr:YwiC-like family protein [Aneurinibacillus sp. B1]WCN39770.1 YwiC-like family protein [Aneurinibacillus sp. B1]
MIPKQHGAWGMLFVPFVAGASLGGWQIWHLPALAGWLLLYLAIYPLLLALKTKRRRHMYLRWAGGYAVGAIALLAVPLAVRPQLFLCGVVMLPLFAVNMWYARRNDERAFGNDSAAVAALCLGGPTAYVIGTGGSYDQRAFMLWFIFVLFFLGSIFFVKTMIRKRDNRVFRLLSWVYHITVPLTLATAGFVFLAIAYVPSLVRALVMPGRELSIKTVGLTETANLLLFVGLVLLAFR